jgi:hypothetical protein
MIILRDKATGSDIGPITESQLQCLIDHLEKEDTEDQDYWLNRETIESLQANGADPDLVRLLESAMGEGDEVEVEWVRS